MPMERLQVRLAVDHTELDIEKALTVLKEFQGG